MSEYFKVTDIFGENVFNDTVMKERLPKKVYTEIAGDHQRGNRSGSCNCRYYCT